MGDFSLGRAFGMLLKTLPCSLRQRYPVWHRSAPALQQPAASGD